MEIWVEIIALVILLSFVLQLFFGKNRTPSGIVTGASSTVAWVVIIVGLLVIFGLCLKGLYLLAKAPL